MSIPRSLLAFTILWSVFSVTSTVHVDDPIDITVIERNDTLIICGGELRVVIQLKNRWMIQIYDNSTNELLLQSSKGKYQLWFGRWTGVYANVYLGYLFREGADIYNEYAKNVIQWKQVGNVVEMAIDSSDWLFEGRTIHVELSNFALRQFDFKVYVNDSYVSRLPEFFTFPVVGMSFQTDDSEGFYGFGQRMTGNNQRGNVLYNWLEDGSWDFFVSNNDTSRWPVQGATYMPMPFFISSRGYGMQLNVGQRSTFDLAKTFGDQWSWEVEHSEASATFFMGRNPTETLWMFTKQRGLSLIPPPFTFGPWKQMSNVIPGKSDFEVAQVMLANDIPFSLCQGYVHFFPDGGQRGIEAQLKAQNDQFHTMGIKSTCYFNPFVATDYSPVYQNLTSNNFLVKDTDGNPYVFLYMTFWASQIDFTNKDAVLWYQNQMLEAISMGFDGWMYDFAEYTPINSVFDNGQYGLDLHNYYAIMYQKAAYDLLTQKFKKDDVYAPDFVYFHRSGYTQSGAYAWAHWTGDPSSDWSDASGLPAQISACLSSGLSGIAFCGSGTASALFSCNRSLTDIGGYVCQLRPPLPPDLLCRWVEFGAFSGIMRDETAGSDCEPERAQIFSTNSTKFVWRKFAKLRTVLFPYIYTAAHQVRNGLPIMRHHLLDFPQDPTALKQQYQYMFGDSLLVAPVVIEGATYAIVYLPLGEQWIDVFSVISYDTSDGRFRIGYSPIMNGGQHVKVNVPLESTALFVRAGSIIPTLDPSVYTLNNESLANIVSAQDMSYMQHLWVWPDNQFAANGSSWDGSEYSLSSAQSVAKFQVVDPLDRIFVVQLISQQSPKAVVDTNTKNPLPTASSWTQVASIDKNVISCWYWDKVAQVIWIRLQPSVRSVTLGS